MISKNLKALAIASASFICSELSAEVRLPSIVSDGMILQRDVSLKVWGWADAGEKVTVNFLGKSHSTKADSNGDWQLSLPPAEAGGPHSMRITGNNEIKLDDILIGDVWLASGQSNMTHAFNRWQEDYASEIANSKNDKIRQFSVPTTPILSGPANDVPNQSWKKANPDNLLDFTVVGYFFAKTLHDSYDVPQGIIMSCVGGTRIEAWTSEEGLKAFPKQLEIIERNKDSDYVARVNAEAKADREEVGPKKTIDQGTAGEINWYDPAYKAVNWKPINIPGYWEHQGVRNLDGVVWYRREVEVPESMTGIEVTAKLGRIRNADDFYVNGQRVGGTGYEYPQRRYKIPTGVLKSGKNLLVVRVRNDSGNGGFIPDRPYQLEADGQAIDLKGTWHYRVGEVFAPATREHKQGISAQSQPSSLYNGMIAPLTNYQIRGALWYQGEANASNPQEYRQLLPNLITDWRNKWSIDELSFFIAQLPRFMDVDYLPAESNWAELREVQLKTGLTTPNTGTGINIDLGEWNDIHPAKKGIVGERLALLARSISYSDKTIVPSGPIFTSQEIKDGKIVLSFHHVGSGLVSNNGEELAHFAIAGEDKRFVWASAEIAGDKVVVSSKEVSKPRYVRYAWADNPDFANLANKEGLPAAPFRTDN
ncbi:sialate O-acetylesterase [Pelagicoccus mobilis]|uniref:Sialate O-acetylesterase domain-containing protein n=1 Tax=Pelagicoccus mobilis TaxID=415221 RepID=A0A934VS77_9BACT|nr:sialate O-acetylesterase [Pelagicoccus mobilis]MBK1878378.1 hypothetical protein [Pelagicoccus mobilis]